MDSLGLRFPTVVERLDMSQINPPGLNAPDAQQGGEVVKVHSHDFEKTPFTLPYNRRHFNSPVSPL